MLRLQLLLAALVLAGSGCASTTLPSVDPVGVDDDDATDPVDDDDVTDPPDDDDDVTDPPVDDDDVTDPPDDDDDATDPPTDCESGPDVAAEADLLAAAMDLPLDSLFGAFADDLSSPSMFAVRTGLGVICPLEGQSMALLSTGQVDNIELLQDYDYPGEGPDGAAGDAAILHLELSVPEGVQSASFVFFFLTREYPEWVGSAYGDGFEAYVTGPGFEGSVAFDVGGGAVNSAEATFRVVEPDLAGTGFDVDGGTGWLRTQFPVTGGESVQIALKVYDVADGVWDSAVLLDGFEFLPEPVDGVVISLE